MLAASALADRLGTCTTGRLGLIPKVRVPVRGTYVSIRLTFVGGALGDILPGGRGASLCVWLQLARLRRLPALQGAVVSASHGRALAAGKRVT